MSCLICSLLLTAIAVKDRRQNPRFHKRDFGYLNRIRSPVIVPWLMMEQISGESRYRVTDS